MKFPIQSVENTHKPLYLGGKKKLIIKKSLSLSVEDQKLCGEITQLKDEIEKLEQIKRNRNLYAKYEENVCYILNETFFFFDFCLGRNRKSGEID